MMSDTSLMGAHKPLSLNSIAGAAVSEWASVTVTPTSPATASSTSTGSGGDHEAVGLPPGCVIMPNGVGVLTVAVRGHIGAGKTTLMRGVQARYAASEESKEEATVKREVRVVCAFEGADESPFKDLLYAHKKGRMDALSFQICIKALRAKRAKEAKEAAVRMALTLPEGSVVIILLERDNQDAKDVFIPANRSMIDPETPEGKADLELFDMVRDEVFPVFDEMGPESLATATLALCLPGVECMRRMDARGRAGEEEYSKDTYLPTVHDLYETKHREGSWRGGPTYVLDAKIPETTDKFKTPEAVVAEAVEILEKSVIPSVMFV